jgi:predicted transcriptional regulator
MDNSQLFIEKYKELEAVVRKTNGLPEQDSISYFLKNQNKFNRYYDDISFCQEVRNFMQHKKKINARFAIEPNDAMLVFIEQLINRVTSRPQCKDICIKFQDIEWRSLSDSVKSTIKIMRQKVYTHIPIIENGVLIGVFDENSLFNYVAENEIIDVDNKLCFADIRQYLSFQGREMEEFLFVKSTMYVEDLEKEIQKYFSKNKRVGIAFLTVNGRENEPIQGIITPWDIISAVD